MPLNDAHSTPEQWINTRPLSHALPMRMMLLELRSLRSQEEYLNAIANAFFAKGDSQRPATHGDEAAAATLMNLLEAALKRQEDAYTQLDLKKLSLHDKLNGHKGAAQSLQELERQCAEADKPLKRVLHGLRGNALTFSGGGIRSASFCLGVLQGLARFTLVGGDGQTKPSETGLPGLLKDTQYLSTVSGGGYLGCWFSSWIARLAAPTGPDDLRPAEQRFREAYDTALCGLAGRLDETSADPSPQVIRHLREYTAYLAPQLGLSLDVWALITIALRNLLINWLMLVPLLLIMITLPFLLIFAIPDLHDWMVALLTAGGGGVHSLLAHSALYVALFVLALLGAIVSGQALPSYRPWSGAPLHRGEQQSNTRGVFLRFVLPLLAICFLLAARFFPQPAATLPSTLEAMVLAVVATIGFGILGMFKWWTHYATYPGGRIKSNVPMSPIRAAGMLFLIAVLLGGSIGVALELVGTRTLPALQRLQPAGLDGIIGPMVYIILALPAFLTVLLLGSTLFSALTQDLESEEDREWWSRSGGFLLVSALLWVVSTAIVLVGTIDIGSWHMKPSISGGVLGLITSLIAKSSVTNAGARPEQKVPGRFSILPLLLPVLAILSVALLAVGLARLVQDMYLHVQAALPNVRPAVVDVILLVLFAAVATLVNRLVNINIFSLHGLYRERLMRAFLGASNTARHPDNFIDFDSSDTLMMCDLAHTPHVPLHIVNATLNLVGTRLAAWRQRKAEAFSFSSLSAGAWRLNYVRADAYGGDHGVTVATAMAISGAAADPNMGYHSSPLVTLLMTLFNVRLGWWLPNPRFPLDHEYSAARRDSFLRRSGPLFSVWPLLQELFGLTDDSRGYVDLSDGGHFENLGLYEMVMRRCRNIIVVDSGADATYTFEDLGNALRKIEIDLGIPIRFQSRPSMRAGEGAMPYSGNHYCAVATIQYSCVDGDIYPAAAPDDTAPRYTRPEPTLDGTLVYIKACLTGVHEPMDVIEYARNHSTFPHESTGNQFFNEAQFESHRSLGSYVIEHIAGNKPGSDWTTWIHAAVTHAADKS